MANVAEIKDGKLLDNTSINSTKKRVIGTDALGKDAFMQLLVTQMQYQDPLNPSSDTDYIAQLATFSQLEQLTNLNSSFSSTQAMNLVGKTVTIETTDSTENVKYITGVVDYTTFTKGSAKVCVNGNLYDYDKVREVYDSTYLLKQGAPNVTAAKLEYSHENPKDVTIDVDLGTTSIANSMAVLINNTPIAKENLSLDGKTLTIKAEAFKDLKKGMYDLIFAFDDPLGTIINGEVSLDVKDNPIPVEDTE